MTNPLLDLDITPAEWELGRTWYPHMMDRIEVVAARLGYEPDVAAAMFAAISPGMGPDHNLDWMRWVMVAVSHGVEVTFTPPWLKRMLPYGWKNIFLAEQIAKQRNSELLTGVKRTTFYNALMGDPYAVTLDVHALKPFDRKSVRRSELAYITACYDDLAQKNNEMPRTAQAAVWCNVRLKAW